MNANVYKSKHEFEFGFHLDFPDLTGLNTVMA
jgi:hypothetical protein